MLQAIRDRATGVISWIIIGMLVLGFVVWQLADYAGGTGDRESTVVEVNGEKITTQEVNSQFVQYMKSQKETLDNDQQQKLREQVLEGLVQVYLVSQYAKKSGYTINSGYLQQIQPEAREIVERQLLINRLENTIAHSEFLSAKELEALVKANDRTVDLSYLILSAKSYQDKIKYDDAVLAAYYEKHKLIKYTSPVRVKMAYVQVRMDDMVKEVKITDEEIKQYYEQHKDAYKVISAEELAKVQRKAEKVQATLKNTAKLDFAKAVTEHSDDKLLPGGDLGIVNAKSQPEFYKAIEKLKEGDITAPVKTDAGLHILKLTSLKPGPVPVRKAAHIMFKLQKSIPSLDLIRAKVEGQVKKDKSMKAFKVLSEKLSDLAVQNTESLDIAAEQTAKKIQVTDWFTREGKEAGGLALDPKVRALAFGRDVLSGGDPSSSINSSLLVLDVDNDKMSALVMRLKEYSASKPRLFSEIKETVKQDFVLEKTTLMAKEQANALLKDLTSGKAIKDIIKEQNLKMINAQNINRMDRKHPEAVINAAFKLGVPQKSKALFDVAFLPNGDAAVVSVDKSSLGDIKSVNDQQKSNRSQFYSKEFATSLFFSIAESVRNQAKVVRAKTQLGSE